MDEIELGDGIINTDHSEESSLHTGLLFAKVLSSKRVLFGVYWLSISQKRIFPEETAKHYRGLDDNFSY